MGSGDEGQAAPAANCDSVRLILEYARQQYERIDARHESLVQRSSTFLGLLVVVVGLVAAAPLHGTSWRVFSLAGLAIVFVDIILFVKLTRLKTYEWTPDTGGLIDGYLHKPEETTRRHILSNTRDAIAKNEKTLKTVQRDYQRATIVAVVGSGFIVAGVVVALLTR